MPASRALRRLRSPRTPSVLAALGVALSAACTPPARPNLLLVTLDTTRADRLGAYGFEAARTPHLDAFARDATLYEHAYATSSWTLPSHASLFTGLLPMEHGAQTAAGGDDTALGYGVRPLDASFTTLAERLARAGYRTGAVVGGPALRRELGVAQGFEVYEDDLSGPGDDWVGRRAAETTDRALARIRSFGDEPWFLFVNYFDPHAPYRPPPPHDAGLEEVDRAPLLRAYLARLEGRDDAPAPRPWEREALDALLAGYDAEIAYMDRHLGRLLAEVADAGPTWVAITADHGESFGEHSHLSHGAHLYEDNVRVPLLVREPERRGGALRIADRTSNRALFAEALAAAGLEPPADAPRLADPRPVVLEVGPSEANVRMFGPYYDRRLRAVVAGSHKLVRSSRDPDELYDLEADPGERHDLAAREPQRAEALARILARVREDHPPRYPEAARASLREDTEAALRALGYLDPASDSDDAPAR